MEVIVSSSELKEPPCELKDVHTAIVKDSFGNPIFVAVHQSPENIWVTTPDDPKFEELVKNLGITKRITIQREEV